MSRSINKERLLDTFLELVRIDSPSGEEAAVAAYCKAALETAGCTVRFDDSAVITGSNTGNLLATLPAYRVQGAAPLFFSAHMDTVGPCRSIQPSIRDNVIYSDGNTILGGDDKAGIAAILEVVRCLQDSKVAGEDRAHPRCMRSASVAAIIRAPNNRGSDKPARSEYPSPCGRTAPGE